MPTIASRYEYLDTILRSGEGDNIRNYDQAIASREASDISVILTSSSSDMTQVGSLISTTDREFRRAVAIFDPDYYYLRESQAYPRPISPNYGGLEIVDAAPGSFYMLLKAWGAVESLLTSKPIQALTAAVTLSQGFGTIRFWQRRKKDPLEGISARQALDAIKAFGGDAVKIMQGDRPDLEIEIQQVDDEAELVARPEPPGYEAGVDLPTRVAEIRVGPSGDIRGQRRVGGGGAVHRPGPQRRPAFRAR